MKNINFSYDGVEYIVTLTTKEDSFQHFSDFSIEISKTKNFIRVRRITDDVFSTATNIVHEEKLALNKVKASEFLDWYIRDAEDYSMLGCKVFDMLRDSGKATLSVVDLFKQSPFIPSDICEYKEDEIMHYRTEDVIFDDDLTPVELTDHQKMYYYEQKF